MYIVEQVLSPLTESVKLMLKGAEERERENLIDCCFPGQVDCNVEGHAGLSSSPEKSIGSHELNSQGSTCRTYNCLSSSVHSEP
jgi:hypothetical protein